VTAGTRGYAVPVRTASVAVAALVACALLVTTASAGNSARPRVTLFGDSVAASLTLQAKARKTLGKGLDLQIDAKVCRRLAETGCPYKGERPPSVLQLVSQPAKPLGGVVVIDVGYNDVPSDYGADIDRVMQALQKQGVATVIWVTMQERRVLYRTTNAAIRAAAKRWPQIEIADWDDASTAKSTWFVDDGLHLTSAGAVGLARFLRPLVLAWTCTAQCLRKIADPST
jgi:lysophospholipase L1-like esterase